MTAPPADDLVVWLREQLGEDERLARAASAGPWLDEIGDVRESDSSNWVANAGTADRAHIVRWDPVRVLREVEAWRKIVDLHTPVDGPPTGGDVIKLCPRCFWTGPAEQDGIESCGWTAYPCVTLCALALPYSDRPGYRQEWAP